MGLTYSKAIESPKSEKVIVEECTNTTTLLGDDINYSTEGILTLRCGDVYYCFDEIDAEQLLNPYQHPNYPSKSPFNPWTKKEFTKEQLDSIKDFLLSKKFILINYEEKLYISSENVYIVLTTIQGDLPTSIVFVISYDLNLVYRLSLPDFFVINSFIVGENNVLVGGFQYQNQNKMNDSFPSSYGVYLYDRTLKNKLYSYSYTDFEGWGDTTQVIKVNSNNFDNIYLFHYSEVLPRNVIIKFDSRLNELHHYIITETKNELFNEILDISSNEDLALIRTHHIDIFTASDGFTKKTFKIKKELTEIKQHGFSPDGKIYVFVENYHKIITIINLVKEKAESIKVYTDVINFFFINETQILLQIPEMFVVIDYNGDILKKVFLKEEYNWIFDKPVVVSSDFTKIMVEKNSENENTTAVELKIYDVADLIKNIMVNYNGKFVPES